ncbi:MAG: DUF1207 domain-containing protein [Alphaproteobacteria bacterium]
MNARYLPALFAAVLLLAGPFRVAQATLPPPEDSFLAGYVSAIVVREFEIAEPVISVVGGFVTVRVAALPDIEKNRLQSALSELNGVLSVRIETAEISDAQPKAPVMAQIREPAAPAEEKGTEALDAPESARGLETLPGGRLFNPLWADPRWAHFSAAYHYYRDDEEVNDAGTVSFGESFGLLRGSAGKDARWQVDFQAAVFGIFDLNAESKDLINADYWVGIPVSYRNGNFSAMARVFHQSSHLGDEFLLRRQDFDRVNLSYESVDLKTSYEFDNGFRLYGGAGYLFHRDPADLAPWSTQIGAEYAFPTTYTLPIFGSAVRPVAAADLQNREENNWRADLSLRGGIQFENPVAKSQQVQLMLEYFNGRSPNGQFYDRGVEYIGLGMHVYLE